MLPLLVDKGTLVRLPPSVPVKPLEVVVLAPEVKEEDGEVEPPAEEIIEPVGNSVLVALGWLVLARLGAVGPLELVMLDSA
jgi:hypothetical protein